MRVEQFNFIIGGGQLDLAQLAELQQRPEPFAPGEARFWEDPYISQQMLDAHLDPDVTTVSRRPEVIDREVAWLAVALQLRKDSALLDLGCGPGFYARRFARHGMTVTGIDYAPLPLTYAHNYAKNHDLKVTYVRQDYLTLDVGSRFDAVLLVHGDFSNLSPNQAGDLLDRVHRALKPGGRFALEVVTREHGRRYGVDNQWYVAADGFWREARHLVMREGFYYPEERVQLNQYVIVDKDGTVTVYRNWFQHYTPDSIAVLLADHGFGIAYLGADLRGTLYSKDSPWIAVVAQKGPPPVPGGD
jgi:SAM-dependent methyltransferase